MTRLAIGRKLCCYVIGVSCCIVIRQVTRCTGVGCIVVVSFMAGGAIVGDGRVCPIQHIIVVVDGEACRCPVGCGRVTLGAVRREIQSFMIGVFALVKVGLVTARAGGRGTGKIAPDVALGARHGRMCAGEGPHCIVVESGRHPTCFRMAYFAIGRELIALVVGLRGLIKIFLMAGKALRRCSCIPACVTCNTRHADVLAAEWESGGIMVEGLAGISFRVAG